MDFTILVKNAPLFLILTTLIIALIVFLKFQKNRILVETLTSVDGGCVSSSSRYCIAIDKKTKTKHLKQMFGNKVLYCPSQKYFKKVDSVPFIGIQRHLTYIKNGKDVKIVLPSSDFSNYSTIEDVDYRRWLFLNEREEFLRKIDKDKIMFLLSIYAPLVVIIATILFFAVTIMYQIGVLHTLENNIDKMTQTIINTIK